MRHWKWAFIAVLILSLCVAFVFSCGDDDDDSGDDDSDDDDDDANADKEVWTDSDTGLMWQNEEVDSYEWDEAITYCDNLSWGGYNDWRLPTISELRSLIRNCEVTETGGSCGVTDSCLDSTCWDDICWGCDYYLAGPGPQGQYWSPELEGGEGYYWSSSDVADDVTDPDWGNGPWCVNFGYGTVDFNDESELFAVRCVR